MGKEACRRHCPHKSSLGGSYSDMFNKQLNFIMKHCGLSLRSSIPEGQPRGPVDVPETVTMIRLDPRSIKLITIDCKPHPQSTFLSQRKDDSS